MKKPYASPQVSLISQAHACCYILFCFMDTEIYHWLNSASIGNNSWKNMATEQGRFERASLCASRKSFDKLLSRIHPQPDVVTQIIHCTSHYSHFQIHALSIMIFLLNESSFNFLLKLFLLLIPFHQLIVYHGTFRADLPRGGALEQVSKSTVSSKLIYIYFQIIFSSNLILLCNSI